MRKSRTIDYNIIFFLFFGQQTILMGHHWQEKKRKRIGKGASLYDDDEKIKGK